MSATVIAVYGVVGFVGYVVVTITAFGSAIIFVTASTVIGALGVAALSNIRTTVATETVMDIIAGVPLVLTNRKGLNKVQFVLLLLSTLVGVPLGTILLTKVDIKLLSKILGSILCAFAALKCFDMVRTHRNQRKKKSDSLDNVPPPRLAGLIPQAEGDEVELIEAASTDGASSELDAAPTEAAAAENGVAATPRLKTRLRAMWDGFVKHQPHISALCGVMSGVLGGMFGMSGPPLMIFVMSRKSEEERASLRSTLICVMFCNTLTRTATMLSSHLITADDTPGYAAAAAGSLVGVAVGSFLRKRVSGMAVQWMTLSLLTLSAILLIVMR